MGKTEVSGWSCGRSFDEVMEVLTGVDVRKGCELLVDEDERFSLSSQLIDRFLELLAGSVTLATVSGNINGFWENFELWGMSLKVSPS